MPFEDFPIEGDSLPIKARKGTMYHGKLLEENIYYKGWMLLLDELPSAPKAVQAACYQLILDRMTGQNKLHDNVLMVGCGNLLTDGAIVNPLSSALVSRMIQFHLKFSYDDFMSYAADAKFDYRVLGFLRLKPNQAYKFEGRSGEDSFPCPRTWEFVSDIIKPMKKIKVSRRATLSGTVGQGAGLEFYSFCQIYATLPEFSMLMADPEHVQLDFTDMAIMHALGSILEANINATNAGQVMKLVERMPAEFQVLCIQNVAKRDTALASCSAVMDWIADNVDEFVDDSTGIF